MRGGDVIIYPFSACSTGLGSLNLIKFKIVHSLYLAMIYLYLTTNTRQYVYIYSICTPTCFGAIYTIFGGRGRICFKNSVAICKWHQSMLGF
jgi:hypothetical protein